LFAHLLCACLSTSGAAKCLVLSLCRERQTPFIVQRLAVKCTKLCFMNGDHPFLSRCVISFSFMACSGHHVSLRLLSLLRGMNISPCHKKGKNAVSLLHVSDIPDLLVSCLLSFVSGYRENLYLSLSSHCQRVMSLSVKPSTHEVLDIISPPS